MWFVVALMAVLTVILLSGKGGFLIAGYNTASKKEKAEYNEVKLSRVMGTGMGIITIILGLSAIFQENSPAFFDWIMPVMILITVIVMLILSNTICRNKNPQPVEESKDEQIRTRKIMKYTLLFVLIVFCVVGVLLVTGDVKVDLNDDKLYINASYWSDQSIDFEDIQSVTYTDDMEVGDRTNGLGSFKLQEGHFKNGKFGKYIRYCYRNCKSYIVIQTNSDTFVINAENSSDTEKLYGEILERVGK